MGIRQQLTPREDRAVALLWVTTARGVSLDRTDAQIRALGAAIAPRVAAGAVRTIYAMAGTQGRATHGFNVLTLAPRGERARSERKIVDEINRRIAPVIGVRAFAIQPDALGIRGAGRGLTFAVVGGSGVARGPVAGERVRRLKQDTRMGPVRLNVYIPKPQRFIEASRDRAAALGTDITGRGEALQAVLDGRRVGQAFVGAAACDVTLVSTAEPVRDPGRLDRILLRAASGQMVRVRGFVRIEDRAAASEPGREGQLPAIGSTAGLTPALAIGPAPGCVRRSQRRG